MAVTTRVPQDKTFGIRLAEGVSGRNLAGTLGIITLSILPLLLSATILKSFLMQQCGVDPVSAARKATWVGVTYALCYALGSPLFGYLSDRWGRRPVVVLGFLLAAPFHALTGFLTSVEGVVLAQAVVGLGQAGATSMLMFAALNYVRPVDRPKAVGLCGAAIGAGVTVALPLGAHLFHRGGEIAAHLPSAITGLGTSAGAGLNPASFPFLAQGIVSALCAVLALVFLKPGKVAVSDNDTDGSKSPVVPGGSPISAASGGGTGSASPRSRFPFASLLAPRMLAAYGAAFLLGGTGKIFGTVLKPWGLNAHMQAANGIGMAVLGAAFGFVAVRVGPFRLLAVGLTGLCASYAAMFFLDGAGLVAAAFLASTVFVGMIYPVPLAIAFSEVEGGWNGTSAGIHQGFRVLGELMFALISEAMFLAWFPATGKLAGISFPLFVSVVAALFAIAALRARR